MAIGRKPQSIFTRAISFAPKKKSLSCSGTLSSLIRFRSLVSDFKKMNLALPFELLSRSSKNLRTILSRPASEPFGKDIIALYTSNSVTKKLLTFSVYGAFKSAIFGCLDTNLFIVRNQKRCNLVI